LDIPLRDIKSVFYCFNEIIDKLMKSTIFSILIAGLLLSGCNQDYANKGATDAPVTPAKKQAIRYGMITGIKPEKLSYYKKLHAGPWPAVVAKIKECHIENYSIHLQKVEEKYYLFSYFEYTGQDFDADMKKMAADTVTQRWWKETDPCQLPLPEALASKQVWTRMDEVFYLK
jgi:L-rhamnose mutarotase